MSSARKETMLDDSRPIACAIKSSYNVKDHTEYLLLVKCSVIADSGYEISKRYSHFVSLDSVLSSYGLELPLPPKKVFGNMDSDFVQRRLEGLQNYINVLLSHPWVSICLDLKVFLCPDQYLSYNIAETAVQKVSMIMRSESRWQVRDTVLSNIGWRLGKCCMMVTDQMQPKTKCLLTWSSSSSEGAVDDAELEQSLKFLTSVQHPGIAPVLYASSSRSSVVVIREFSEIGTLRDLLCNAKPLIHFMKKYANPKSYRILQPSDIQLFGRQILETVKFLHERGFPFVHVHSGNIVVRDGQCQLLDLENSLLGIPSLHRRWFIQLRKLQTAEAIEVYCFGRLLYEMITGRPFSGATCDVSSVDCTAELKSVLELLLSSNACKSGLPTVNDLLRHPFFSEVKLSGFDSVQLRIPSKVAKVFETVRSGFVQQLNEEQRQVHQYHRISKAQAFHMSEEERNKRKVQRIKSLDCNGTPATTVVPNTSSVKGLSNVSSVKDRNSTTTTTTTATATATAPVAATKTDSRQLEIHKEDVEVNEPTVESRDRVPPASSDTSRVNLLSSITAFDKTNLRKAQSVDGGR